MSPRRRLQSLLGHWIRRLPPTSPLAAPLHAPASSSPAPPAAGAAPVGNIHAPDADDVLDTMDGGQPDDATPVWIPAGENPWGVSVLNISPVTLSLVSASAGLDHAENAVSYHGSDGREFEDAVPASPRTVDVALRYRVDRMLADGVLHCPTAMEDKWAIFHRGERLLLVRSWTRQVVAVARTRFEAGWLLVTSVEGTLTEEEDVPGFTQRVLDYLIRTHVLGVPWPVPLPGGMEQDPQAAALYCFAQFGRLAHFATAEEIRVEPPVRPLRSDSALHIAAARADLATLREQLARGVPVDLLASDGLAPLHWALASGNLQVVEFLLDQGTPVDVRSEHGTTPLMLAAQRGALDMVRVLLMRGAQPDAQDDRGFMALHAAAHEGRVEVAQLLIACDCDLDAEARGETPRTLATRRHHPEVVHVIDRAVAQRGGAARA